MSELQIENPTQISLYTLPWTEVKNHILKVAATFPKEYSIIKDEEDTITILNIPIAEANKAITRDQIIYISNQRTDNSQTTVKMGITNEVNKILSYTELERDKRALNIFSILLEKSIKGILMSTVASINESKKPKVDFAQAFIQIVILIVALFAIFYGLEVFFNS